MIKINKFFILIISEVFFLLFLLIILPSFLIKERPGVYQTSFTETLSLDTKNSFNQEFISDQNNLQSVSVLLKNPGIINKSQIKIETENQNRKVIIKIQDQNKNILNSLTISGLNIGDPSWITIKLPQINSKKGDKFFINISTDNQLLDHFYIYGNKENQNINFKTTYKSSSIINSIKENLNYRKETLLESNHFYFISYLIILIITNIFIFFSL